MSRKADLPIIVGSNLKKGFTDKTAVQNTIDALASMIKPKRKRGE